MIASLQESVQALAPAFTEPSFVTHGEFLIGWVVCLGRHRLCRVADSTQPQVLRDHAGRHGLDVSSNFFERPAWTPSGLAYRVGVLILTRLQPFGRVTLLVDDPLAPQRGRSVWGLGWWRDAVASTKKRVATASGHNGVVLAVAVGLPFTDVPIRALPRLARLQLPGKAQPSCAELARGMLGEVLTWWPGRCFTPVADGAYATEALLGAPDERVTFVGRMRGDAAVYDPRVPVTPKGRPGRKAKKGPRLPKPREAAAKADRQRRPVGAWAWQEVVGSVYGCARSLRALASEAVWPRVVGYRPVPVVVVRGPSGRMRDGDLFTTDLKASPAWVITMFAWRWAIEGLFRASKQVLDIEAPQHWARGSVEEVAPWVGSMQSVVMGWYLTAGRASAEAEELRGLQGDGDREGSLRQMLQGLRRAVLNATIDPDSGNEAELREMVQTLKNWANLAA